MLIKQMRRLVVFLKEKDETTWAWMWWPSSLPALTPTRTCWADRFLQGLVERYTKTKFFKWFEAGQKKYLCKRRREMNGQLANVVLSWRWRRMRKRKELWFIVGMLDYCSIKDTEETCYLWVLSKKKNLEFWNVTRLNKRKKCLHENGVWLLRCNCGKS